MKSAISFAIYLLAGALLHVALFGHPDLMSVTSWGVIVFWPIIVSGIAMMAGLCLLGLVLAVVAVFFVIAVIRDCLSTWARRRRVGSSL